MFRCIFAAAIAGLLVACATAQDNTEPPNSEQKTNAPRIVPEGWQQSYEFFHYAPAVRAGDTIYLSGIIASLQGEESEQDDEDLEAAFDRAFESLGGVLTEAGANWSDVIEMTTFHTELIHQIDAFMVSKDKYLTEPYPAWTAIDVDRLYPERGLVEIKLIAYVGE
ncbi:MAG: RidA family protein [Pseudomonadota bacterium]